MSVSLRPDVYATGRGRMQEIQKDKQWFSRMVDYARNRLAIMTAQGNPHHIAAGTICTTRHRLVHAEPCMGRHRGKSDHPRDAQGRRGKSRQGHL